MGTTNREIGEFAFHDLFVARLNTDGTRDESFGERGFVTIDFGSGYIYDDFGYALAIDSNGRIVVTGRSQDDSLVARLDTNGQLDLSFGDDGKKMIDFAALDVAIDAEDRIVLAGSGFTVARLDGSGQFDTSFDDDGKQTIGFSGSASKLAIDSAGRIVLVGISQNDFAVARLDGSGQLDTSFDEDGQEAHRLRGHHR